ncbi:MAG: hypothetical protein WC755_02565 [Candidatus Woesearchaeota archaeon]
MADIEDRFKRQLKSNRKRELMPETEIIVHEDIDPLFRKLVGKDYYKFMDDVKLASTPRQKELLSAQSIHGHAMNGHVEFQVKEDNHVYSHTYPNSTVEDVYSAILVSCPDYAKNLDAIKKEKKLLNATNLDAIKEERLALITELEGWINATLENVVRNRPYGDNYSKRLLVDSKGEPLMGISMLSDTLIGNPKNVLIGLYLGSCMDSPDWREQAEDYFSKKTKSEFSMHRGLCTAVNIERLNEEGLTVSDLSHLAKNDFYKEKNGIPYTLDVLKDKGIVVDYSKLSKKEQKYGIKNIHPFVPAYIELNKGYGSSDDAAFTFASIMYTMGAGIGLILADAVDTIDKCLPTIKDRGADEDLGVRILDRLGGFDGLKKHLGIDEQDVMNLIYAASIDKNHPESWPSCSQRRFLQKNERGNYALLNHMEHIKYITEGADYPQDISLSFDQISSHKFFNEFRKKIKFMLKNDLIDLSKVVMPQRLEYFID